MDTKPITKNFLIIILPALLTIFVIFFLLMPQIRNNRKDIKTIINKNNNQPANMANPASVYCEDRGGSLEIRTDDQGGQVGFCLFDDGSECEEWSYFRGECYSQGQTENISDEIKQLFIQKYNKDQNEVQVIINQQTTNYARGSVKFGLDGIGEGGIFLATKINNKWQLIFDGNGIIPCSQLESYNFPETMATDCFDY